VARAGIVPRARARVGCQASQARSHPTSLSHRQRRRFADSNPRRHLRPTKPGAPNTRSPRRSHPGRPKPAHRSSLNRRPVPNPQIRSSSGGKFHIDRHQRRCELPPRFSPSRLFGRLPPCTPSRLCLAAVRKPLTRAGVQDRDQRADHNSSSSAFASFRSGISKPSVNQP